MIELTVNGTPYTDFLSARVTLSLETMSNDFDFTASSVGTFPPFKQGDDIEVLVDREKVLTGTIDEVAGIEEEGNYKITYSGRDKTGDFVDSDIDIINDIRAESLTLKKLIETVIAHLGQSIEVIDNLVPEPFNLAEDFISPFPGENAFLFVSKYARKRQALLTSDADSNIVITQSSPVDSGDVVQSITGGDTNNIIGQSWGINASKVFNKYIYRGQFDLRAANFAGETDIATVVSQSAEIINTDVRIGRQRVIIEPIGYSSPELKNRAKWSSAITGAAAVRFVCAVKDHQRPTGGLWAINNLVQVNSDAADITRKMLVNTVTFTQADGSPTATTLEFVEQNAYTIDEISRAVGRQGDVFQTIG